MKADKKIYIQNAGRGAAGLLIKSLNLLKSM
jgi:hypothetical protein